MRSKIDKKTIVKVLKVLVGRAERGEIESLIAIGRWVRIREKPKKKES